jgi:hypothetical protein
VKVKEKKVKKELPLIPQMYMIKSAFRRLFPRSGLYVSVLNDAISEKKGVRGGKQIICCECGESYGTNKVNVDHKEPVVPIGKTINDLTVQECFDRIWCDKSNLQVLCNDCHDVKTKEERLERKKAKVQK